MKIYISGPMSGIRNMNYPAFEAAEQMLLDDGWDVVSPHRAPRKESRDTHAPEGLYSNCRLQLTR